MNHRFSRASRVAATRDARRSPRLRRIHRRVACRARVVAQRRALSSFVDANRFLN
jgi:hypothetical protein